MAYQRKTHGLTPHQIDMVLKLEAAGLTPDAIAAKTRTPIELITAVTDVERNPIAMTLINSNLIKNNTVSRQNVLDGYLEAIDLARLQADPAIMMLGWEKIAKLMGFNAPEKHIQLQANMTDEQTRQALAHYSDAELMELAQLPPIDGVFTKSLPN